MPRTPSLWWRQRWPPASSGVTGLEAAVLVAASADDPGIAIVRELSPTAVIIVTDRAGNLL
jgi:hypothetical protein